MEVWRRIPPWHFPDPGQTRPKSAAFADDPDGGSMSVVIADAVLSGGRTAHSVLAGHDGFALGALATAVIKDLGLQLVLDPHPDEPAHALVVGHKTRATRRAMAKASRWVIPPPEG